MREAVLQYHRDGWPLLLGQPGRKRPMPGLSVWDATTDLDQLKRWGIWWPTGGVMGNVLGRTGDGFAGLDDDPAEGSGQTIAELAEQGFELPPTRTHCTPSGGRHWIYLAPVGLHGGKLGDGLMVRGWGSYIVLPPSVVDGKPYVVLDDRPPVELPDWVVDRLDGRASPATEGPFLGPSSEIEAEPVDLDALPWHLVELLDAEPRGWTRTGRSGQLWRLVASSLEWGLTDGQVITLAQHFAPGVEKYGRYLAGEVARCLGKLRARHPHPGQPCDRVGCANAPTWQRRDG